ncbi:MAG: 5-formyltetrahydrofolate cyclo-ligase [Sediminibacterium sp.]
MMTKERLRQLYKAKRAALDAKDRLRQDDLILLQFQQMDYSGVQTLLTYWPIAQHAEPNTHLFSSYLRHMVPNLTVAYPVMDNTTHTITAHAINEETVYHTNNQWGIPEPKEGIPLEPTCIDLVFVPLLVCDEHGYRVGYGKGFYDRFLARCRKEVVKIGFSYFEPVRRIADTHQFDVPLTFCVTPQHVYEF